MVKLLYFTHMVLSFLDIFSLTPTFFNFLVDPLDFCAKLFSYILQSKLAQYTEKSGIPLNWEKMVVMGEKIEGKQGMECKQRKSCVQGVQLLKVKRSFYSVTEGNEKKKKKEMRQQRTNTALQSYYTNKDCGWTKRKQIRIVFSQRRPFLIYTVLYNQEIISHQNQPF